jgi:hypothetical protein
MYYYVFIIIIYYYYYIYRITPQADDINYIPPFSDVVSQEWRKSQWKQARESEKTSKAQAWHRAMGNSW